MRGKIRLNHRRISAERIWSLRKDEVFVFGSNVNGEHVGGAARTALENFGAKWGKGMGMSGQSYAIPTMNGKALLKNAVYLFLRYAKTRPDRIFLVTKIGCGVAGYPVKDIAKLFRPALSIQNVYLPAEFFDYY